MLEATDVIDEKVIKACEIAGACSSGLTWLMKKPRTYKELRSHSLDWYRWLASHKNYPDVLELLAKDADVDVRRGVAQNATTPPATLELLAKDADVDVRWGVAQNATTPPATLELLAKDASVDVRWAAKRTMRR
jgi:hypothetical protein